ncbi:MAG: septum formation initiator family protein [Muribaculaceae bacterium]|nr:septum formation initiator family protein [Muribaculaceae bacterium]
MGKEKTNDNNKKRNFGCFSFTLLIVVAFVVFMMFFSDYSWIKSQQNKAKIQELNEQIQAKRDSAAIYSSKTDELYTDEESLEKVLREKYDKHSANEDVYKTDIK